MVKYTIYEIVCKDPNIKNIYVGHTTNFTNRHSNHTDEYNDNKKSKLFDYKLYKSIRDNGGCDNWIMSPLETFCADSLYDALLREQYWMDFKNTDLNQINAIDKNETRRTKNKEKYKENKIKKFDNIIENVVAKICKQNPEKEIDINDLKSYVKKENNIVF